MMRAVVNWLRLVWPPGWIVALAVLFFLAMIGLDCWLAWFLGTWETGRPFAGARVSLVFFACVSYAIHRVYCFHPLLRPGYASWLALTPWTSAKPLPLGPLHLVWQDGVMIALLYVLGEDVAHSSRIMGPMLLLSVYLAALGLTFWPIGLKWATYSMLFGLGLAVRLAAYPWAALCVILLVYVVLRLALRQALEQFPWDVPEWLERIVPWGMSSKKPNGQLGWPFDVLQPEPAATGISYSDVTLASLLSAWWLYALLSLPSNEQSVPSDSSGVLFYCLLSIVCVLGRLIAYCEYRRSPISLWGRIVTLRWIIRGYDQVLLAPLCTVVLAVAAPFAFRAIGLPENIAWPCAVFAVLFVTLAMGPSRQSWFLTGDHRITIWSIRMNRRELVEL